MDEHLSVIETTTILKLLDAHRATHEALYDLVMLMSEKQREQNNLKHYPKPKMTVNR